MTNIKDKIQQIKLARMDKDYRFVAECFYDLEIKYVKGLEEKIFFIKNGVPVMEYLMHSSYLWCDFYTCWEPLENIIRKKYLDEGNDNYYSDFSIRIKVREILTYFASYNFNLSNTKVSVASRIITDKWKTYEFIDEKNW